MLNKTINNVVAVLMMLLIVATPVSAQCLTAEAFEGKIVEEARGILDLETLSAEQTAQVLQYAYIGSVSGLLQDSGLSDKQISELLDPLHELDYEVIRNEFYYTLMQENDPSLRKDLSSKLNDRFSAYITLKSYRKELEIIARYDREVDIKDGESYVHHRTNLRKLGSIEESGGIMRDFTVPRGIDDTFYSIQNEIRPDLSNQDFHRSNVVYANLPSEVLTMPAFLDMQLVLGAVISDDNAIVAPMGTVSRALDISSHAEKYGMTFEEAYRDFYSYKMDVEDDVESLKEIAEEYWESALTLEEFKDKYDNTEYGFEDSEGNFFSEPEVLIAQDIHNSKIFIQEYPALISNSLEKVGLESALEGLKFLDDMESKGDSGSVGNLDETVDTEFQVEEMPNIQEDSSKDVEEPNMWRRFVSKTKRGVIASMIVLNFIFPIGADIATNMIEAATGNQIENALIDSAYAGSNDLSPAELKLLDTVEFQGYNLNEDIQRYLRQNKNDYTSVFKVFEKTEFEARMNMARYFAYKKFPEAQKDSMKDLMFNYLKSNSQENREYYLPAYRFILESLDMNSIDHFEFVLSVYGGASKEVQDEIITHFANLEKEKEVSSAIIQSALNENDKVSILKKMYAEIDYPRHFDTVFSSQLSDSAKLELALSFHKRYQKGSKTHTDSLASSLDKSGFSKQAEMIRLVNDVYKNRRDLSYFDVDKILELGLSDEQMKHAAELLFFFEDRSNNAAFLNEYMTLLYAEPIGKFVSYFFDGKKIAFSVDVNQDYNVLAYEMLRDQDISRHLDVFKTIYKSDSFIQKSKNMGSGEKFSFAQTVFRNYKETTGKDIDSIIASQFDYIEKASALEVMGPDTGVILFAYKDLNAISNGKPDAFKTDVFRDMFLSSGVKPDNLNIMRGDEDAAKDKLLDSIIDSSGKTVVSLFTHGSPGHIGMLSDPMKSGSGISYVEFGDALVARMQKGQPLDEVTIITSACYSYDFAMNLYNYLINEKKVKSLPIIIGMSNRKSTAKYNAADDIPDLALEALYKIKPLEEKRPLTISDYRKIDNYVYKMENTFILIPSEKVGAKVDLIGSRETRKDKSTVSSADGLSFSEFTISNTERSTDSYTDNVANSPVKVDDNPVGDKLIEDVKQRVLEVNDYFTAKEVSYLQSLLQGSKFANLIATTPLAKVVDGKIQYARYTESGIEYTSDYNSPDLLVRQIDSYLGTKGYKDFKLKELINPNLNPDVGTISEESLHIYLESRPDLKIKVLEGFNQEDYSVIKEQFLEDYPAYNSQSDEVIKEEVFVKLATDNYYGALRYDSLASEVVKEILVDVTRKDVKRLEDNMIQEYSDNLYEKLSAIKVDASEEPIRLSSFKQKIKNNDLTGYGVNNLPKEVLALIGVVVDEQDVFAQVLDAVSKIDLTGVRKEYREYVIVAAILKDIGKLNHDVSEFQKTRYQKISADVSQGILERLGYSDVEIQTIMHLIFYHESVKKQAKDNYVYDSIDAYISPTFASGITYEDMTSMTLSLTDAFIMDDPDFIENNIPDLYEVRQKALLSNAASYDRDMILRDRKGVLSSLKETAALRDVVIRGVARDHFLNDFRQGGIDKGSEGVYVREGEGKDDLSRYREFKETGKVDFFSLKRNAINERSISYLNGVLGKQASGAFYVLDYEQIKDMPYVINTKGERIIGQDIPFSKVKSISTTYENYVWMKREIQKIESKSGEGYAEDIFGRRSIEEVVDFSDKRRILADTIYKRSKEDALGLSEREALGVYDFAVEENRMKELSGYLKAGPRKSISGLISDYREGRNQELTDDGRKFLLSRFRSMDNRLIDSSILGVAKDTEQYGIAGVNLLINLYNYEKGSLLGDNIELVLEKIDRNLLIDSIKHMTDSDNTDSSWSAYDIAAKMQLVELIDYFGNKLDSTDYNSLNALGYFLALDVDLSSTLLVRLYELGKEVSVQDKAAIIGILEHSENIDIYDFIVDDYMDSLSSINDEELNYVRDILANSPFLKYHTYLIADLYNRGGDLNYVSETYGSVSVLETLYERMNAFVGKEGVYYSNEEIDDIQKIIGKRLETIYNEMPDVDLEYIVNNHKQDLYSEKNRLEKLISSLNSLKKGEHHEEIIGVMSDEQKDKLLRVFEDWNSIIFTGKNPDYYSLSQRLFDLGNQMGDSSIKETAFLVADRKKSLSDIEMNINPFLIENGMIMDIDRSIGHYAGSPITIAELSRDKFADILDMEAKRLGIESPDSSYYTMNYKGVKFPVILTERLVVGDSMVAGHASSSKKTISDLLTDYQSGEDLSGEILSYSTDYSENINTIVHEFKHKMDQIDSVGRTDLSSGDWEARSMLWEYMFGLNQKDRMNKLIDNFKLDSNSVYEEHRVGFNQMFLGFYRKMIMEVSPDSDYDTMQVLDIDVKQMKSQMRNKIERMSDADIMVAAFDVYNNYIFSNDPMANIPGGEMHTDVMENYRYHEIDYKAGQKRPETLVSGLDSHEIAKDENPFYARDAVFNSKVSSSGNMLSRLFQSVNILKGAVDKIKSWFTPEPVPDLSGVLARPPSSSQKNNLPETSTDPLSQVAQELESIDIPGLDISKLSSQEKERISSALSRLTQDQKSEIAESGIAQIVMSEILAKETEVFSQQEIDDIYENLMEGLKLDNTNTPQVCS